MPDESSLTQTAAETEWSRELEAAREVQQRLLPTVLPNVPGWDFAGRYIPARVVGGDYWSVKFHAEENIITCKLADVTGHGLGAAILAAAVKFVSGVLFRYSGSPAQVMSRTNHSLLRETAPDTMATMVYGWLYPDTGRARIVNAGHFPAFVCRNDGTINDIPPTGPLLGLMEFDYDEWETHLASGDIVCFCSDGIMDTVGMAPNGDTRIKEIVAGSRTQPAVAIVNALLHQAQYGANGAPPADDQSIVVIKRDA